MYELSADGWMAGNEVKRLEKKTKKKDGKEVAKEVPGIEGLEGRLIPPSLIICEYFNKEQKAIKNLKAKGEAVNAKMDELKEEQGGEEGLLVNAVDGKQKINKKSWQNAMKPHCRN